MVHIQNWIKEKQWLFVSPASSCIFQIFTFKNMDFFEGFMLPNMHELKGTIYPAKLCIYRTTRQEKNVSKSFTYLCLFEVLSSQNQCCGEVLSPKNIFFEVLSSKKNSQDPVKNFLSPETRIFFCLRPKSHKSQSINPKQKVNLSLHPDVNIQRRTM